MTHRNHAPYAQLTIGQPVLDPPPPPARRDARWLPIVAAVREQPGFWFPVEGLSLGSVSNFATKRPKILDGLEVAVRGTTLYLRQPLAAEVSS